MIDYPKASHQRLMDGHSLTTSKCNQFGIVTSPLLGKANHVLLEQLFPNCWIRMILKYLGEESQEEYSITAVREAFGATEAK